MSRALARRRRLVPHTSRMVATIKGTSLQQKSLEEMITNSMATPNPITCIIADSFFPWMQATVVEISTGKLTITDVDDSNEVSNENVTAGVSLSRSDFLSNFPFRDQERLKICEWWCGRYNLHCSEHV